MATKERILERIVKGFSNHRRIKILFLLQKFPELSVEDIAEEIKVNVKTASDHINKMSSAGLIAKRYDNKYVRHKLTSRGEFILKFLTNLSKR